jgi:putative two-component system response regulator
MSDDKAKILIVDDEGFYIDVLVDLLKKDYKTVVAKDGEQALRRARATPPPDLMLLDVVMPGMNGYEVCRQLKEDPVTRDIPVVFLTIKSEVDDELRGFELGAADYIAKPMSPPIVVARVRTHLALSRARRTLAEQNRLLEAHERGPSGQTLSRAYDAALFALATLAETRDAAGGRHVRRIPRYLGALAERLRGHPRFAAELDAAAVDLLFRTAPLHDIGKAGVPDRILLKPGPLGPEEWQEMQRHARYGHDALLRAERELGAGPFLSTARAMALNHHERWDGSGYPQGLAGEAIPLAGRLMAPADVYDALTRRVCYRGPIPHERALEVIRQGAGSHFDPDVAAAFLALGDEIRRIATRYADD